MNAKGYDGIPSELCHWITFLSKTLPLRSVGTFIELLMGAMLSPSGFVTEAYLMLNMRNHWTSYYKWLQKGRWSWVGLARQFLQLVLNVLGVGKVYLVIDDTLTLRSSKKAPASQIHHQHGNKPNLSLYVRGQCWVSLALVGKRQNGDYVSLPILSRLIPSVSNTGKLIAAKTLIRAIQGLLKEKAVTVLVDAWYMRRVFIESMMRRGFHVTGQVRIDTRLYDEPSKREPKRRGRPRKYGRQVTQKRLAHFKKEVVTIRLYGKEQKIRYRTRVVKARYLEGRLVRAVWCEILNDNGQWKAPSLLLSTNSELSAEEVIQDYGMRWSIESMFNQLKLAWGLKEAWQQTRQCLHRWVHLTSIGYGLLQLLSCLDSHAVELLCNHSPWRKGYHQTPGQIRKGLQKILMHVDVRSWWDIKSEKFGPPI
tara:strand:+ start:306 stop:1574 length:1269 start_codon:yes stop_codon:yes gene_type:complete